jgi:hypothetical protein
MFFCSLKNSYPYDGDDKDDYVYIGEYDKSNRISSEPIDICIINDKIKGNIILESDNIALSDITLTEQQYCIC